MGLLWWKCDSMRPMKLFSDYKPHTGLGIFDSMAIIRIYIDDQICLGHVVYQQFFKNILVEGGEFREHYDPSTDQVILSNGKIIENLDLPNSPEVSESEALGIALDSIGAETYAWQNDSLEYWLQQDSVPEMSTYYPNGELVYALIGDRSLDPINYKLAWKYKIYAISPRYYKEVYVDAINGDILKEVPLDDFGDFNHIYYGNKYLDTRWWGGLRNTYYLKANDDGRNIKTRDDTGTGDEDGQWKDKKLVHDDDDHWGNNHWAATSCHHVVQEAWAFFRDTYGQDGFDDNKKEIRVEANVPNPWIFNNVGFSAVNSSFDKITYGAVTIGTNIYATYDVTGHEFTHGKDNSKGERAMVNEGETGSLEESFGDIFGAMTERFAKGSYNWTMKEDANATSRDMQTPENFDQPSWYQTHSNWIDVVGCIPSITNDYCFTHKNDGVQNKYFYLLSMGGAQNLKTVGGVGIDIAAEVTFYSFLHLTESRESYPLAREHAIAAARILYGTCSYVENQVCRAWSACNIGPYCEPCAQSNPCWNKGCGGEAAIFLNTNNLDKKIKYVSIYPNPAKNIVSIKFNELTLSELSQTNAEIKVTDLLGRLKTNIKVNKKDHITTIDISNYESGIYFIVIYDNNGIGYSFKIIKE